MVLTSRVTDSRRLLFLCHGRVVTGGKSVPRRLLYAAHGEILASHSCSPVILVEGDGILESSAEAATTYQHIRTERMFVDVDIDRTARVFLGS